MRHDPASDAKRMGVVLGIMIGAAAEGGGAGDEDVGSGFDHSRDAVRLEISAVSNTDLAFDHRYPVKRLAFALIS